MTPLIFAAGLVSLALVPLVLIKPRNIVVNPAAYVLVVFTYAILAKAIYFTHFYQPNSNPIDRMFGFETTTDFLWGGISIAAVAAGAYVLGFIAPRKFVPAIFTDKANGSTNSPAVPLSGAVLTAIGFGVAFLLFAAIGGHDLLGDLSHKRFLPTSEDTSSRFARFDYYFFKIASLALPLTVVAGFAWLRTSDRRWGGLFWLLLAFSIYITIFANVRLIFIIMGAQLLLLAWTVGGARRYWLIPVLCLAIGLQAGAATLLRTPGQITQGPAIENQDPRQLGRVEKAVHLIMRGRYFMDLSKMARIADHFPNEHPFLNGQSWLGVPVTVPATLSEVLPERDSDYPNWTAAWGGDDARSGTEIRMSIQKYLAAYVFREPNNNITVFTGRAYADFGHIGVALVFLLLGLLHRLLFNAITHSGAKWWVVLGGTIVIPPVTFLLLNSGALVTITRLVTDLSVIPICLLLGFLWQWIFGFRRSPA